MVAQGASEVTTGPVPATAQHVPGVPPESRSGEVGQQECLVTIRGVTYDVSKFIDQHPGGRETLSKRNGQDITEDYEAVGHSSKAERILSCLPVIKKHGDDNEDDSQLKSDEAKKAKHSEKLDGKFLVRKLFTQEDKNNVHKTLGGLALLSFAYRYFYVFPTTGTLGFAHNSYLDLATLFLHLLLSYSSIIFHVLEKRIIKHPLIIYEEYRLHAMLFTTRAIGVSFFGLYQQHLPENLRSSVLVGFLVLISLSVDYVTQKFGTPGVTAVRNDNDGNYKFLRLFYASYQFYALASHIRVSPLLCDLGYNAVIAIQSSAFLMTLKRKSLIRWYTHAFWYTLALTLSIVYMAYAKGPWFMLSVLPVYLLRVTFNLDKYLLWAVYLAVCNTPNYLLPEAIRGSI